ncbi:hypothetical protein ElyMa_004677400 [Elysia marginata]|uniref:Uncharacterized protein n=1 Tax=Elysia marginata TaxID=1093978 RepID=A0AAV4I867_9GAST|nr:hypothetical protein ElyMa_004677400 [Elysia marginata]
MSQLICDSSIARTSVNAAFAILAKASPTQSPKEKPKKPPIARHLVTQKTCPCVVRCYYWTAVGLVLPGPENSTTAMLSAGEEEEGLVPSIGGRLKLPVPTP